eukprot:scaffold733_cov267-Pinguiococcus_pyrenoidosus.AAC.43
MQRESPLRVPRCHLPSRNDCQGLRHVPELQLLPDRTAHPTRLPALVEQHLPGRLRPRSSAQERSR